jgi:hypothetical protein
MMMMMMMMMMVNKIHLTSLLNLVLGRAIAKAVSRWLPTTAARVCALVWSSGSCGGQSNAGTGFL